MAVQSAPSPESSGEGGGAGRFISTQRAGGEGGLPPGARIFLVLGGNTLVAVLAATGSLDLDVGFEIGLGLVLLVWLFDVIVGWLRGG